MAGGGGQAGEEMVFMLDRSWNQPPTPRGEAQEGSRASFDWFCVLPLQKESCLQSWGSLGAPMSQLTWVN